jgi:hypothetical protein
LTLILATVVNQTAILAADRRIHDEFSIPSEDDKLFIVSGCALATYGSNPPGVYIPEFIRSFERDQLTAPKMLAETIYNEILMLPDYGSFGVVIIGINENIIEIWEVLSQGGVNQVNLELGQLCQRGQPVQMQEQPVFASLDIAHREILSIFRQVASQTPYVGPPYEFAEIRDAKVSEISREN